MYIDSHCHLDFACFDENRPQILQACTALGVNQIIIPSTQRAAWPKVSRLCQQFADLYPAYGIHPYFLADQTLTDIDYLGMFCETHNAIAVGEIGLDNWPGSVPLESQVSYFEAQLQVAKALSLPVILHARKSYDLVLTILRRKRFVDGGVVHAFNGSWVQAQRFIALGFVLGIGGTITYPRARKAIGILQKLTDDDFVLETDAPDMPISGFQGQPNSPLRIPDIALCVAQIRGQSMSDIARHTSANVGRIFPHINKESVNKTNTHEE